MSKRISLWHFMALYGTLWHFMALYGTLWHFMALYGTLWHFMALYGTLWHCLSSMQLMPSGKRRRLALENGKTSAINTAWYMYVNDCKCPIFEILKNSLYDLYDLI